MDNKETPQPERPELETSVSTLKNKLTPFINLAYIVSNGDKEGLHNFSKACDSNSVKRLLSEIEEETTRLKAELEEVKEELGEKEVMINAFDKIQKLFAGYKWLHEGRGMYRYDDDRYKLEVKNLMDAFNTIRDDTWGNIKTKTFEYHKKIIKDYVALKAGQQTIEGKDRLEYFENEKGDCTITNFLWIREFFGVS